MKVYLVMEIADDEYFCREVVHIASSVEKAIEWIENHGGFFDVVGWDDRTRPYRIIDTWGVDAVI